MSLDGFPVLDDTHALILGGVLMGYIILLGLAAPSLVFDLFEGPAKASLAAAVCFNGDSEELRTCC